MKRSTIIEIISILFMILFLYTGISKLTDHSVFREQIAESPILAPVAAVIAWSLPIIEFTVVILLFITNWRLKGLYASLILMILFTGYVIALVSFSDKLPCSCGGVLEQLSWRQHIVFNIVFTGLALWAILLHRKNSKLINGSQSSLVSPINIAGQQ
ncbi:MAG TPA: MauE/DoxX family redox-associated membrane protein [Puia sp.]|nr:MauE/DoxX family redox-associated membrane protein [Puia sp.]